MKKIIIAILLFSFLTGCSSSKSTNMTNLDKTYTIFQISYKVSSTWGYDNIDGANYHYLPDGSVLFVSNSSFSRISTEGTDMLSNMLLALSDFKASASDVEDVSSHFDSQNNTYTASYSANSGKGIQLVNYFATVKDKYLYYIVLTGEMNSKDKLDKVFKEIISGVSLENGTSSADIGLTKYEIIKMMDQRLKENNYNMLSKAAKSKSTLNMEGSGSVICEIYTLTNGMYFAFYSDIKTDQLLQLAYVVDKNKLSAGDYEVLGFVNGSLPYLFERDTYKELDTKLGMNNESENAATQAAGAERKYYYFSKDNLCSLFVYPVGKEILVQAAQETQTAPSPTATTPASPSASPTNSGVTSDNAQQQTQQTTPTNIYPEITPTVPADTQQPQASQPVSSAPANSAAPTPTKPSDTPTPVPADNPQFTANINSEIKYMDLIMFEGTLSGISSPQDVVITCHYPNGNTVAKTKSNVSDSESVAYPFETEDGGLGSGYITVSLASTGQILGTYNFTVVER